VGNVSERGSLSKEDELLHPPTNETKWRESYYFNWVDLNKKVAGFSTIGILPNEQRREFVFLLFMEDRNEIYYKEPKLESYSQELGMMLRDNRLSYELITPFKTWNIEYKSRMMDLRLVFEARFPTHHFGVDSSASWQHHFEASGRIHGSITLKGAERIEIEGFGQRDKSWGYRDWHQFTRWYAGHFQFKNWAGTFRKDFIGRKMDLSGHNSKKNGSSRLIRMEIKTTNDKDSFSSPLSAVYTFTDESGRKYKVKAKRIGKKYFIRFVRDFDRGYTELFEQMVIVEDLNTNEIGSGMMEHLRTVKK
jgi:hypothetical protein